MSPSRRPSAAGIRRSGSIVSSSIIPPRQRVGGCEGENNDAGHQGAVFLRKAAHGDLGSQGLEQQTSGRGAQDAAPAALKRNPADDARGDRIQLIARRGVGLGDAYGQSEVESHSGELPVAPVGSPAFISANSRHGARGGLRNRG